MKNYLSLILIALILLNCGEAVDKLQEELKPIARGNIGEIILVMDSAQWGGSLGSTLRATLRQPIPGLPQDEPMFSVSKAGPRKLNTVLKSAANMIIVMTLDSRSRDSRTLRGFFTEQSLKKIQRDTSIYMKIQKDEFARGQVVLFLFAKTEALLNEKLIANKSRIQSFFENRAQETVTRRLYKKHQTELEKEIAEEHQFSLGVPYGWERAVSKENFYWMRLLQADKEQDVFIYYEPYVSTDVFTDIPSLRDRITEKNLRDSEVPSLYITRQIRDDIRAIFINQTQFKGQYAIEARGLWKVNDNSIGGPYVSYTFVDEKQQRLYYIEGYVAAPGSKKGKLIREVEAILYTFKSEGVN